MMYNCLENLLTIFDFYPSENKLELNAEISPSDLLVLIDAFTQKLFIMRTQTGHIDRCLVGISLIATAVFKKLTDQQIMVRWPTHQLGPHICARQSAF